MPPSPTVAIVIPIYSTKISQDDERSLKAWDKHLSHFDTFVIAPKRITAPPRKKMKLLYFPDEYFRSVQDYSRLLLSPFFYEKFSQYDYILIYQLDAVVFSGDLLRFVQMGFDYIGAPLRHSWIGWLTHQSGGWEHCGNGGLSIRKVTSSIQVLEQAGMSVHRSQPYPFLQFLIAILSGRSRSIWLHTAPTSYPFNEDGFWSFEATKYLPTFRTAPIDIAATFAIEKDAQLYIDKQHGKLPFGVHAWKKYDPEIWSKHIEQI